MATLAGEIQGRNPSIVAAPQQQQQQHNDAKNLPISVSVLVRSTNYIQNIKSVPEKNSSGFIAFFFAILSLISNKGLLNDVKFTDEIKALAISSENTDFANKDLKTLLLCCLYNIRNIETILSEVGSYPYHRVVATPTLPFLAKQQNPILYNTAEELYNELNIYYKILSKPYLRALGHTITLPNIYKYMGLKTLVIESFKNRTETYIGFNNYIDFKKPTPPQNMLRRLVPGKDVEVDTPESLNNLDYFNLLNLRESTKYLSKFPNEQPQYIIINEWDEINTDEVNKYLTKFKDIAGTSDILKSKDINNLSLMLFDETAEYKLLSCISTNYIDKSHFDKLSNSDKFEYLNDKSVIFFLDENNKVYTYPNINRKIVKQTIFRGNIEQDEPCNQIVSLPGGNSFKSPGVFSNEVDYLLSIDTKTDCFYYLADKKYYEDYYNFSMTKGNRVYIYCKVSNSQKVANAQKQKDDPKKQTGDHTFTVGKKQDAFNIMEHQISDLSAEEDNAKTLLTEIGFNKTLIDIKSNIAKYYTKTSDELIDKIITNRSKVQLRTLIADHGRLREYLIEEPNRQHRSIIYNKIMKDLKNQKKSIKLKLDMFLTLSFKILISKITSRTDKELKKYYNKILKTVTGVSESSISLSSIELTPNAIMKKPKPNQAKGTVALPGMPQGMQPIIAPGVAGPAGQPAGPLAGPARPAIPPAGQPAGQPARPPARPAIPAIPQTGQPARPPARPPATQQAAIRQRRPFSSNGS
jgi:hypothetical protein